MSKNSFNANPNWDQLIEADRAARESGSMVGRFVAEPYADGKAYYVVVRENKKTVVLRHVSVAGTDHWRIPSWGDEPRVDVAYVKKNINSRDFWENKLAESRS